MSNTEITPQTKITMLKLLTSGRDLAFVAAAVQLPRDVVLDVVSNHGYPNHDRMVWAIGALTGDEDRIPEKPSRPAAAGWAPIDSPDHPKPSSRPPSPRSSSAQVSHVPPATASILHRGKESGHLRTRNLASKIHDLLADLTDRLEGEQAAAAAEAKAEQEFAATAARIAQLEDELAKLKGKRPKPAKKPKPAAQPRAGRTSHAAHPCTEPTCVRTFDTPQGASLHQRRAHEGFTPGDGKDHS